MSGWPFLVARGRRRGYSVLLAPDFLVAEGRYGFIEDVVGPTRPGATARVASATTGGGHPVCLVWTEHRVTAHDLGGAGEDPVDEHSRPLDLLHGVLFTGTGVDRVAPADLAHAHDAALATYRRFLTDEEDFVVAQSTAFDAATAVASPAAPSTTRPPTPAPARGVRIAVALAVSGIGLFFGLRQLTGADEPPPPPVTCTSVTPTPTSSTGGTPSSATCPPERQTSREMPFR